MAKVGAVNHCRAMSDIAVISGTANHVLSTEISADFIFPRLGGFQGAQPDL